MRIAIEWPRQPEPRLDALRSAIARSPGLAIQDHPHDGLSPVWDVVGVRPHGEGEGPRFTVTDVDDVPLALRTAGSDPGSPLLDVVVRVAQPSGGIREVRGVIRVRTTTTETLVGLTSVLPVLLRAAADGRNDSAVGTDRPGMQAAPASPGPAASVPDRRSSATWISQGRRIRARLERELTRVHWQIGVATDPHAPTTLLSGKGSVSVEWLRPSARRVFWADPHAVVDEQGTSWIFVEEFPFAVGNGHIRAIRLEGAVGKPAVVAEVRPVLGGIHHRALPRVLRHEGRWLATADGCEHPARVFTFDAIGDSWAPVPGAFLPPYLTDPMLGRTDDGWIVTGTNWTLDEGAACEVWVSASGPPFTWQRVDRWCYVHPVLARGAGFQDGAADLRGVQDCSTGYGLQVSMVSMVPDASGSPRVHARLGPERLSGGPWAVAHTASWAERAPGDPTAGWLTVVDAGRRVVDPRWPVDGRRELAHFRACVAETLAAADPADL